MARIKHYNPDTQQWEYSDISSIQQNVEIDYEEVNALINAATKNKANKSEVESHIANKLNPHEVTAEQVGALPLSGGDVTGSINFVPETTYDEDGNPIINMELGGATYIDKGELSLGGSKITGGTVYSASTDIGGGHNGFIQFLSVGDNVYISNIPDPIESDEVANKGYVDKKVTSYTDSLAKVYAQSSEPTNPKDGDIWIDTDDNDGVVFATVATSGDYNDLINKPTAADIGAVTSLEVQNMINSIAIYDGSVV